MATTRTTALLLSALLAGPALASGPVIVEVTPQDPDMTDTISVTVSGYLPDPCHEARLSEPELDGGTISLVLTVAQIEGADICAQVIMPFSVSRSIGSLEDGTYLVEVVEPGSFGSTYSVLGQADLEVEACSREAGEVRGVMLDKATAGSAYEPAPGLRLSWLDPPYADDYVVFQQTDPRQVFDSVVATSTSGLSGSVILLPEGSRFYLVRGRNDHCGLGY